MIEVPVQWITQEMPVPPVARPHRPLRAPDPEVRVVAAPDGVPLRLTRYRAGDRGPVILAHGLGVSSRIFTIDTLETTLVESLCEHGFDTWLLDSRASIELPTAHLRSTADDVALGDWPAAVATVRAVTGARAVHAVAHCYGATTLSMALLAGMEGVRSAVYSQVGPHVATPWMSRAKAYLQIPWLLREGGIDTLTARVDGYDDDIGGALERAFDLSLQVAPRPEAERCDSAVCRRITFLYGPLYGHDHLNDATHDALGELFGVASTTALEHLTRMVRRGHVVAADGREAYLPHLARLAMPTTFLHGAENACYLPECTATTVAALRAAHDPSLFERHVLPGYGHIDCIFGRDAATDVYPLVLRHLDRAGA